MPFFDCPEDAIKAVVQRLGGAKAVGSQLWPDKTADAAGRALLDALNPDRPEKLSLTQILFILRLAHDAGVHEGAQYLNGEIGYDVRPVSLDEQVDHVVQVIDESSRRFESAVRTLAHLKGVEK